MSWFLPDLPRGYKWLPPEGKWNRLVLPNGRMLRLSDIEVEWLRLRMRVATDHLSDAVSRWNEERAETEQHAREGDTGVDPTCPSPARAWFSAISDVSR